MVVAQCSVFGCPFKLEGANKEELIEQLAGHILQTHRTFVRADVLEHKFVKCPVCDGEVNKPVVKCPNCGADLVEQRGILLAKMYTK